MKDVRLGGLFFLFGTLALFAPEMAWAAIDSMGDAADKVIDDKTFSGLVDLMTGFAYLAGSLFGVKAAIQLRDNTENPQQTRLSKPMTSMAASGIFLGLPSFTDMTADSLGIAQYTVSSFFQGTWTGQIQQGNSLDKVAEAFAQSIPSLSHLISLSATVAGLFLMLRAVFMLPQLEQGRVEAGKIMWLLLSGVILWSLLPFVSTVMGTFGMGSINAQPDNILTQAYAVGNDGGFNTTINSVLTFVSMIGLIAFIRGTLILKALGENKDGAMGRALTHIIAGAAAINIKWTVAMLATSIGAKSSICGLGGAGVLCGF